MAETGWKVTDKTGKRRLFEGTEEDARAFVESNFPRVHVEPGYDYGDDGPEADAVVVSPSGEEHRFGGADAGWRGPHDNDSDESDDKGYQEGDKVDKTPGSQGVGGFKSLHESPSGTSVVKGKGK